MIGDNQKRCPKCGAVNDIKVSFCNSCGAEMKQSFTIGKKQGCLASSIFMFVTAGACLFLFIFCWIFLSLLGPDASKSILVVLVFALRLLRAFSFIGMIACTILGVVFLQKSKKI